MKTKMKADPEDIPMTYLSSRNHGDCGPSCGFGRSIVLGVRSLRNGLGM
jgi:hypothetical protein